MHRLRSKREGRMQPRNFGRLTKPNLGRKTVGLAPVAARWVFPYGSVTYHCTLASEVRLPSSGSLPLPVNVTDVPCANDEPFAGSAGNRRIAILNNVIGDPTLPFCGILTEGLPRLMRLLPDEIAEDAEAITGPAELMRVMVNGERASIPNVTYIQHQILKLL